MILAMILSSLVAFGAGRATKHAHETLVVEKLDGSVEVREAKASEVSYEVKRDIWGDVSNVQERQR